MGRKTVECALDKRNQEILTAIIKLHIATGEPVGSRTLSKQSGQTLSPASIRNIMADLEEAGYLAQPHASAGRVPTDKGYRFYVDTLISDFDARLPRSDEEIIHRSLFADADATQEGIMERASHLLSQISTHVGIVLSPPLAQDILQHIEFLRLADRRILVITVSRTGLVRDVIVRVDEDLTQDELNRTARYISETFKDHSLTTIRTELLRRMSEEKALYDRLLKNAILLCGQSLKDQSENTNVYVDGAVNMFNQADFADTERMKAIFRMFEEKGRLVKILNQCLTEAHSGVVVHIGAESRVPGLRDCAIVTSPYLYRDQIMGSVSVVGPMRMKYARIMRIVSHVARLFEQSLNHQDAGDALQVALPALSKEAAGSGAVVLSAD
jgi:heat-inducible transcriptional repressor